MYYEGKLGLSNKTTYPTFDLLKLTMALIVVGRHIGGGSYFIAFTCCAVPTFFVISGFLVRNKEKRKGWKASFEQIIRIVKLYVIWSLIYLPFWVIGLNDRNLSLREKIVEYIQHFLFDGSYWHLWYLPSLAFAIIFFCFIKKIFRNDNKLIIGFSLLCYLIGLVGDSYSEVFQRIPIVNNLLSTYRAMFLTTRNGLFYGLFFYSMGYYLDILESKFSKKKNVVVASGVGIIVGVLITYIENTMLLTIGFSARQNMYIGTAIIAICSVIWSKYSNGFKLDIKKDIFIRRLSTIIYMIHVWIFNCIDFASEYLKVSTETVIIMKWLLVLIPSVVICELMNTKFFRKLRCLC